MQIRETRNSDLIAKLNKSVHHLHYQLYPNFFKPFDYHKMRKFFENMMNKENHTFLLMYDGDDPIGYAWFELKDYPESIFKKGYRAIYVHQIGIDEHQKGNGYGASLMREIEDYGKSLGVPLIELDYWCDNKEAKQFYERQGYDVYREVAHKSLNY
ncbi:GNAT family N-acetyltransferase [Pontibacillus yanchengensis]|uniref:GNAT family acetyltransferase n=1 Tax=Pontibacillus yanchengensis Y32 TaxID=1385514 RepID=A0A0A2TD11_9BACI|nr:GNAT family N-acetyltransferase [Pontibacillus yanchengensis]KGP73414.1 GNAT family acetyltransferase [Pontibacillus yanchengensis Y32]